MGGMGMGGMNPAAMQQQLLQNPDMMRQIMNSPMMQVFPGYVTLIYTR